MDLLSACRWPSPSAPPAFWCLLAAALFGASTPVSKALLGGMGPLTLAGLLYLGAALATAPFARGAWDRRELRRPLGPVVFGGVLGPVLVLLGQRLAPARSVALWLNLEAPATALLGWAFFREHPGDAHDSRRVPDLGGGRDPRGAIRGRRLPCGGPGRRRMPLLGPGQQPHRRH